MMAETLNFSARLSETLASLGMNEEMLQFRKSTFIKKDLMNVFEEVGGVQYYQTGSQVEGTTISLLNPDLDEMIVVTNRPIITNVTEWRPNKKMLLLVYNDLLHPGYVKLKSLDPPQQGFLDPPQQGFRCDSKGDVWFSSTDFVQGFIKENYSDREEQHGPAVMWRSSKTDPFCSDTVTALLCANWPPQAGEWLTRERCYNWPSKTLLNMAEKEGCHLVPVSFIGSLDEDLQWRFSFSVLERELIWSWNDTQRNCLFLLKLILKNYINKKCPDVLSSYQLKTLMFWMVEETPIDEWVPANLTKFIMQALSKLLQWIQVENCPSYFIKENNLFDGKLECQAKILIIQSIRDIISMGIMRYLLTQYNAKFVIEGIIFTSGTLFGTVPCMNKEHFEAYENNIMDTVVPGNHALCMAFQYITMRVLQTITGAPCLDIVIVGHKHCLAIGQKFLQQNNSNIDREVMHLVLNAIHSSLGSHLFAKALQTQDMEIRYRLMKEALHHLEQGQHVDITSRRLKLATCHYQNGDYHKSLDIVDRVLALCGPNTMFCSNNSLINKTLRTIMLRVMQQLKMSRKKPVNEFKLDLQDTYQLQISPMETVSKHYAIEIRFFFSEEPVLPRLAKYECRDILKKFHYYVAFDPVVYAHFLKCLCHFHNKQADKLLNALQAFQDYVKRDYQTLYFKPTTLNLLAHCCFMAGKYSRGLKMLAKSINKCPDKTQNGAPWIMGVLVFEALTSCKT